MAHPQEVAATQFRRDGAQSGQVPPARKLHILSGFDPTARYMIQRLREADLVEHVTRIRWKQSAPRQQVAPVSLWKRLRQAKRLPGIMAQRMQSAFMHWHFQRLDRELCRALFDSDVPPEVACDDEVASSAVNSEAFARRMRELDPALMIVNGAPILRENIFSLPRAGTVNVHFGIAPEYRGVSTIFWPIYYNDFDHLGVTLHYMNQRIDGGSILAHGYPALQPGDSEATIMARCIELAVGVLAELARASQGDGQLPCLTPEGGRGRLFLKRHRQAWHDARLALALRTGVIAIPTRAARVVTYF